MTSRFLLDEIRSWLAEHGPQTAAEIAAGIRARRDDVDDWLRTSAFLPVPGPVGSNPRAQHWEASQAVPQRRAGTPTHKQRVLMLLSDGRPHRSSEGYRLGVMLHSRVADLRRDGHVIECHRDGPDYVYQLKQESLVPAAADHQATGPQPTASSTAAAETNEPVQVPLFTQPRGAYSEEAA